MPFCGGELVFNSRDQIAIDRAFGWGGLRRRLGWWRDGGKIFNYIRIAAALQIVIVCVHDQSRMCDKIGRRFQGKN